MKIKTLKNCSIFEQKQGILGIFAAKNKKIKNFFKKQKKVLDNVLSPC